MQKIFLTFIAVVFYIFGWWAKMDIEYLIAGLILIVLLTFIWMPEITSFTTKYFSLSKKVDKVMVQYREFRETIYPLLEVGLANIASTRYFNAGPKSGELVDFINRVEKLGFQDSNMNRLIYSAKAAAVETFAGELQMIRELNNLNAKVVENFVQVKIENFSSEEYYKKGSVLIDEDGLKKSIADFKDNNQGKLEYMHKINKLINFYNDNF
mgnify:CR=1 FL=1